VGEALVGLWWNPLGQTGRRQRAYRHEATQSAGEKSPRRLDARPVREPLQTGIKAIDSMIPIGRGQRELIIGDRQTGRPRSSWTDHQSKGRDIICIYCGIGKSARRSRKW